MIRKYLVCGKQVFLSSKKLEDTGQKVPVPVLELLLPINLFWDVEKLVQRLDYLIAANEDPVLITEQTRRIFQRVMKYAVTEKDRTFLQEKLGGA